MGIISAKLRASAKGQACTFQIPGVCCFDRETTCLCHAPSEISGMGSKGHDYHAAFGCFQCHEALDQRRVSPADRAFYWLRGVMRTQNLWIERGLIVIPVDPTTAKRRPGKKSGIKGRQIPAGAPLRSRGFSPTRSALRAAGQDHDGGSD